MMSKAYVTQTCLTLNQVRHVFIFQRRLLLSNLRVHCEVFKRFAKQFLWVKVLPLTSFIGFISKVVRLLSVLVDEAESFLVLFLVLDAATPLITAAWRRSVHELHFVCISFYFISHIK